jgi:hypothetical protein
MRRPLLFTFLALVALAGCRGKQRTALVVEVDSNLVVPGEMDTVDIAVTANGKTQHMPHSLVGAYTLPIRTALIETTDNTGTVNIVATGSLNGNPVVHEEAIVEFVEGQAMLLKLFLAAECVPDPCIDPTKTCTTGGVCVSKVRPPTGLTPFDPTKPALRVDAAVAVATTMDAGVLDGAGAADALPDTPIDRARDVMPIDVTPADTTPADTLVADMAQDFVPEVPSTFDLAGDSKSMETGGITGTGGMTGTGGILGTAGTTGTGGILGTGGTGGPDAPSATGGGLGAGGIGGMGGATQTDVPVGTGGMGGAAATGGTIASGGVTGTSRTTATGGMTSTGGITSTGGVPATGGAIGTGGAVATFDPTWAQWPMPNGQVDVTAGAPNLASYTDNGNGTVTDNVTGLMWQQAVPAGTYTWEEAKAYCQTLTLADHGDWRLPSRIEVVSIVDFGPSSPAINTTYFPSTPSDYFWSSSSLAGSSSYAWLVDFGFGRTYYLPGSNPSFVRCVR